MNKSQVSVLILVATMIPCIVSSNEVIPPQQSIHCLVFKNSGPRKQLMSSHIQPMSNDYEGTLEKDDKLVSYTAEIVVGSFSDSSVFLRLVDKVTGLETVYGGALGKVLHPETRLIKKDGGLLGDQETTGLSLTCSLGQR